MERGFKFVNGRLFLKNVKVNIKFVMVLRLRSEKAADVLYSIRLNIAEMRKQRLNIVMV